MVVNLDEMRKAMIFNLGAVKRNDKSEEKYFRMKIDNGKLLISGENIYYKSIYSFDCSNDIDIDVGVSIAVQELIDKIPSSIKEVDISLSQDGLLIGFDKNKYTFPVKDIYDDNNFSMDKSDSFTINKDSFIKSLDLCFFPNIGKDCTDKSYDSLYLKLFNHKSNNRMRMMYTNTLLINIVENKEIKSTIDSSTSYDITIDSEAVIEIKRMIELFNEENITIKIDKDQIYFILKDNAIFQTFLKDSNKFEKVFEASKGNFSQLVRLKYNEIYPTLSRLSLFSKKDSDIILDINKNEITIGLDNVNNVAVNDLVEKISIEEESKSQNTISLKFSYFHDLVKCSKDDLCIFVDDNKNVVNIVKSNKGENGEIKSCYIMSKR